MIIITITIVIFLTFSFFFRSFCFEEISFRESVTRWSRRTKDFMMKIIEKHIKLNNATHAMMRKLMITTIIMMMKLMITTIIMMMKLMMRSPAMLRKNISICGV